MFFVTYYCLNMLLLTQKVQHRSKLPRKDEEAGRLPKVPDHGERN